MLSTDWQHFVLIASVFHQKFLLLSKLFFFFPCLNLLGSLNLEFKLLKRIVCALSFTLLFYQYYWVATGVDIIKAGTFPSCISHTQSCPRFLGAGSDPFPVGLSLQSLIFCPRTFSIFFIFLKTWDLHSAPVLMGRRCFCPSCVPTTLF